MGQQEAMLESLPEHKRLASWETLAGIAALSRRRRAVSYHLKVGCDVGAVVSYIDSVALSDFAAESWADIVVGIASVEDSWTWLPGGSSCEGFAEVGVDDCGSRLHGARGCLGDVAA